MMGGVYKPRLKKAKLGSSDKTTGLPHTTNRGIYKAEIGTMLTAPFDTLPKNPSANQVEKSERDHLLLILLWETWARENELLSVDVEDIDLENRTILLRNTKRKVNHGIVERTTDFSEDAKRKIIKYLKGRKTGPLFLGKEGKRLSTRGLRYVVTTYAVKAGVQKVVGYDSQGSPRYLITPKAFREAGEAYAIMEGMDRQTAARRAGHTVDVQEKNYTKYDEIRARDLADKHRPKFEGGSI